MVSPAERTLGLPTRKRIGPEKGAFTMGLRPIPHPSVLGARLGCGGLRGRLLLLARLLRLRLAARIGRLDELDDRHRGVVAAALTDLDDAGVAAGALLEALGEIDQH